MTRYYYFIDSYRVKPEYNELIEELGIEKYCTYIDGIWRADFVGFILTETATVVSFPKHYCSDTDDITSRDIALLAKLMVNTRYLLGLDHDIGSYYNFPLSAYLNICNYYVKYGLYNEVRFSTEQNYSGRIDWANTMRKSSKLISGNNLIFIPFIVKKNITLEVFITECMVYVLNDGFKRFGKFFNIGINVNKKTRNRIFENKQLVIKQLNLLKSNHFKDSEKLLIQSLIDYFNWSNNNRNQTILVTKHFENYWEAMVEDYINTNLHNITEAGKLVFKDNSNRYQFGKEVESIESSAVRDSTTSRNFSVEYDHLYLDSENRAYLFDSKYYQSIRELDFKQMAYFYILKSSEIYANKQVINGLILPTEEEYYSRTHLDTRDRKGLLEELFIVEHYLNVKEVISSFID